MPETAMNALTSLEQRGHPWRGTTYTRTDWAEGLDVKILAEHPDTEILFWVGCTGALEQRSQAVARSMVNVLKRAGVDFAILGDGQGRSSTWYSGTHWYSGPINWGTWQRVDYKLIGPSDTGTDYDDWINLNINDRDEFIFQSSDKRIWDGTLSPDGTQNPGTQFGQTGNTTFIRERYGFSRYGHTRFDHISASNNASDIVLFRPSELDFIRAEALLNTGGSTAEIAALLDRTHVIDGGYDSAASLAAGSISDPLQPQHDKGATLWSVLKYEKLVDLLGTFSGREYWEKRGWGELTPGNPIQFPVPAKDLETLQLMLYSFGGVGQTGGAPKIAVRPAGEDPKEWRLRR